MDKVAETKIKPMIGQQFGRLTVIDYAGKDKQRHALWKCRCRCGNYKIVGGAQLRNGVIKSCGCLRDDLLRAKKQEQQNATAHRRSCGESRRTEDYYYSTAKREEFTLAYG